VQNDHAPHHLNKQESQERVLIKIVPPPPPGHVRLGQVCVCVCGWVGERESLCVRECVLAHTLSLSYGIFAGPFRSLLSSA